MNTFFSYLAILSSIFAPIQAHAQTAVQANPTRPSAADNAYLAALGYTELELGLAYAEEAWSIPMLVKFSAHRNIELGFIMSGIVNHVDFNGRGESEVGDPGMQLKAQLTDQPWGAIAVAGRVDLPSGVDPSYTMYSVLSYQTRSFQFDATLGGAFFDQEDGVYDESFQYALAVSPKLHGRVGGFVEIFGEAKPDANPVAFDFGLAYAHSPRFVSDLSITIGLNDEAQDWLVQIGFTSVLFKLFK